MYKNNGVSTAMDACPKVIANAPKITAHLYPKYLSAKTLNDRSKINRHGIGSVQKASSTLHALL
jgi:hypothetical protein